MRRLALVVLFAACESSSPVITPDGLPQQVELDVVVGERSLQIFTNGTGQTCDCHDEDMDFPAAGTCVAFDDVGRRTRLLRVRW